MTEAEWLACDDDSIVFSLNKRDASARKFRLYSCACCRRVWHHMTFANSRRAVEVAERYADGLVEREAMDREHDELQEAVAPFPPRVVNARADLYAAGAALDAAWWDVRENHGNAEGALYVSGHVAGVAVLSLGKRARRKAGIAAEATVKHACAHLFRDIFGNPFRPVITDPTWLTPTVLALAGQMYEGRDFSPMPILADALQDAGCDNDDILTHCRGSGPHVRGCWVVDLVLGKE